MSVFKIAISAVNLKKKLRASAYRVLLEQNKNKYAHPSSTFSSYSNQPAFLLYGRPVREDKKKGYSSKKRRRLTRTKTCGSFGLLQWNKPKKVAVCGSQEQNNELNQNEGNKNEGSKECWVLWYLSASRVHSAQSSRVVIALSIFFLLIASLYVSAYTQTIVIEIVIVIVILLLLLFLAFLSFILRAQP